MKKMIVGGIILSLIIMLMFGFGVFRFEYPKNTGWFEGVIHIGTIEFPGYAALYIAEEKELFQKHGLNVVLDIYPSLTEVSEVFAESTTMQGRTNLAFDVVEEAYQGIDQKIVAIADYSRGADALIAIDPIDNVGDLVGKRIAVDPNSFQMYFLSAILKDVFLSLNEVQLVDSSTSNQSIELLKNNEADAAVVFDPYLSRALLDPQIHELSSSEDYPSTIVDVLSFRSDFVETYPQTVQAFVDAYLEAVTFLSNSPEEAYQIIAKKLHVTSDEVQSQLNRVQILDLQASKAAFHSGYSSNSIYAHLYELQSYLLRSVKYRSFVNTDTLIDPTFFRRANETL